MTKPYVITVVGPESSGKTTLASTLAQQLGCLWVPEYARTYLNQLGRPYAYEDLELIAEGQQSLIKEYVERTLESERISALNFPGAIMASVDQGDIFTARDISHRGAYAHNIFSVQLFQRSVPVPGQALLIVDSGMLSLRVWSKLKYNRSLAVVDEHLEYDETSAYILCRPTLPWTEDPLREAPGLLDRVWIYNHYLAEIVRMISK